MFLLYLLLACTEGGDSALINGGDPYVAILSPADEETVCGDPLQVVLDVANFELVAPVEDPTQAEPGTGHVDIMLNGQDADMIWDTSTDIEGVDAGVWQLKVELSNADHTPVEPYVGDLIYITVSDEVCP